MDFYGCSHDSPDPTSVLLPCFSPLPLFPFFSVSSVLFRPLQLVLFTICYILNLLTFFHLFLEMSFLCYCYHSYCFSVCPATLRVLVSLYVVCLCWFLSVLSVLLCITVLLSTDQIVTTVLPA